MAKVAFKFTKKDVDAAGRLITDHPNDDAIDQALDIVNNWRASHGFPLNTFKLRLRDKARAIDKSALVAQRIKRLPAIVHKLEWLSHLKLSQFQDIAGCRAVLSEVSQVRELRTAYVHAKKLRHTIKRETDYIAQPKESGYRSIHLVWIYESDRSKLYNGYQIEMQLRSRLQHAWATAVETRQMFSGEFLKSSQGDPRWLRFFALMSSAMALREGESPVPGTPKDRAALRAELKELARELNAARRLTTYGEALKVVEPKKGSYFILRLNPTTETLDVEGFSGRQWYKAQQEYNALERSLFKKPGTDVVLVRVDDVKSLRAAFPNYYLDTKMFVQALNDEIA